VLPEAASLAGFSLALELALGRVLNASRFPFIWAGFTPAGITGIISGNFSEGYDGAGIGALVPGIYARSDQQG
jgi:hypothetical protein